MSWNVKYHQMSNVKCHKISNVMKCQMSCTFQGLEMSKFVKWQMLFYGKCHQMSSFWQFLVSFAILWQPLPSVGTSLKFFTTVGNFCHFLTTFGYFCHLTATFLPSYGNFFAIFWFLLGICHNFGFVSFGNFLQFFGTFCHVLGNFEHFLPCFGSLWQFLANLAIFGNCLQA